MTPRVASHAEAGTSVLDAVRERLHQDPRPLVLGVSGGADSMVLLHLCAGRTAPTRAIHIHHGLRPSADHDADLVVDTCARLGTDVRVVRLDGETLVSSPFGLESAARTARYNQLSIEARSLHAAILTAHHANDRLETMLLHLGRGTGIAGLAGPEATTVWADVVVERPMLHVWKTEILEWAAANQVPWAHDEMNDDLAYDRVRMRTAVVPGILANLEPEPLRRSLGQLAEDAGLLRWLVARELESTTVETGEDVLTLDRQRLRSLPETLCRAVVHQALLHVLDRADRRARPESRWVADVVRQIHRPGPSVALGRRVRCEIGRDRVKIGYTPDPRRCLSTSEESGTK